MHCLWLTLADPDPATNGQLIYSKGLIEGTSQAGASLSVIGLARAEGPPRPLEERRAGGGRIAWHLVADRPHAKWRRLLSPKPLMATRAWTPEVERVLEDQLQSRAWDVVVFDSMSAGWALDRVVRHRDTSPRPPKIVYLAQNQEIVVAWRIARATYGAKRTLKQLDALKVARLERRLVAEADLVTANSPNDCRAFIAGAAGRPVGFLPPGYGGARIAARTISATVPRRAVVVGTFDWPLKRISLEAFLTVAQPVLARAGVELQIVGTMEADYLEHMRERFPAATFVGSVADVRPYMAAARIALVPDELGGFKLKGLDYVFNRLPILAMRAGLPGMPLRDGRSIGLFDTHESLAEGVVALIDDLPGLNARQELAFAACADRFDWARIGRHLIARIRHAGGGIAAPVAPSGWPVVRAEAG